MAQAFSVSLQFLILLGVPQLIKTQLCYWPLNYEVLSIFSTVNPDFPSGAVFGSDIYYTCMAQASMQYAFRELSVIIQYTHNGMELVKQFELDCASDNTWNGRNGSVTDVPDSFNYTSITTRTDCSSCNNTVDNDYHCEACDPACNVGSRRCFGPGSNDCCPVFLDFSCSTSCRENWFATEYTDDYSCWRLPCTLPDNNTLVSLLESRISQTITLRGGPYYTCLVQGLLKGTYKSLGVILEYTDDDGDKVGHFDLTCEAWNDPAMWSNGFKTEVMFLPGAHYNGSIGLRTDCSYCGDPINNLLNSCRACPDECSVGLNRCNSFDKCCVAFEYDGLCKTNFNCNKKNFVANEENNYTCSCGLASCPDGYTFDSTSCVCTMTDICVADNPCNNNGVCILDTAPDQYTCNCTGTGYTGINCAEICSLTCQRGYVVDENCLCLLDDICVADNPCGNGGTCVLGSSSDKYSCQCVDYYSGINCTECSLECLNRGSVDEYCMSCDCVAGYTGRNCSKCDRGYSVDTSNGGCTPLVNGTSSGTKDNSSSFKWWHVGLPIFLLVVVIIAIVIIVGVLVMKNKQDKHKIISNEIIMKPI